MGQVDNAQRRAEEAFEGRLHHHWLAAVKQRDKNAVVKELFLCLMKQSHPFDRIGLLLGGGNDGIVLRDMILGVVCLV